MARSTRFEKPMVTLVFLQISRKQEIRVDCHARYTFTFIIDHLCEKRWCDKRLPCMRNDKKFDRVIAIAKSMSEMGYTVVKEKFSITPLSNGKSACGNYERKDY